MRAWLLGRTRLPQRSILPPWPTWIWGVADAVFVAKNRRECFDISIDGACWAGVILWIDNFFYGRYPRVEFCKDIPA